MPGSGHLSCCGQTLEVAHRPQNLGSDPAVAICPEDSCVVETQAANTLSLPLKRAEFLESADGYICPYLLEARFGWMLLQSNLRSEPKPAPDPFDRIDRIPVFGL